jgi:hypothetical protein
MQVVGQPINIFKGVVLFSHCAKLRPQISLKAQTSSFSKSSNLLESQTPYLNANFKSFSLSHEMQSSKVLGCLRAMKILFVKLTKCDVIEILMFIMKKPEKP